MAEQEEEKKAFTVKDRRRFDASGNPRASGEEEPASSGRRAQSGDGRRGGPAVHREPMRKEPRDDLRSAAANPRGPDPRAADPRMGDPRMGDPRGAAPNPRGPDPRAAGGRGPDPRDADPGEPAEWRSEWESAQQEAKDAMDAAAEDYPRGAVGFAEFLLSIATNAVIHLGGDTKDGRVPPRVNLPLAAQHIDIIAMIAEKTKGNLDREEQELLDSLLYDLRMKYVAVAQAQSRGR